MNSIYMPGFGDEATWGACTGHPLDPRTVYVEDELAEAIEQATETLTTAPTTSESRDQAEVAAEDAAAILLTTVDVVSVLRQITLTRQQMAGIAALMSAKLGKDKTQQQRLDDKAIAGFDAAVVALWGAQ